MKLPITSYPQLWPSQSFKQFPWRIFKLHAKFDADSLLYSLCHFECDGHTVHVLTQWHLPPPLTSTVKSLFTHTHSSPLSLAARLCCHSANHPHYISNGWTFSRQTLYIYQNVQNLETVEAVDIREILVPSSPFCCKPKIVLKIVFIKLTLPRFCCQQFKKYDAQLPHGHLNKNTQVILIYSVKNTAYVGSKAQ